MQEVKLYKIGDTTIQLIVPQISEEEREERWAEIERVAWMVWHSLTEEEKDRIAKKYCANKQV